MPKPTSQTPPALASAGGGGSSASASAAGNVCAHCRRTIKGNRGSLHAHERTCRLTSEDCKSCLAGKGSHLAHSCARGNYHNRVWRPFREARAFMRTQGLRNYREWNAWYKTDARPSDIPTTPEKTYSEAWGGAYPDIFASVLR